MSSWEQVQLLLHIINNEGLIKDSDDRFVHLHRIPLFAVWSQHRATPWPELLTFWGAGNLQVINRTKHVEKCAKEAAQRSKRRIAVLSSPRAIEETSC
ncbi:hypothetical protein [Microvirga sp. ACRRW]|uniref:hypothetical protein n=1 Tax=Microvirga sp. ACRRW TaxID=2918205 RepID=UPI00351CEFFA